MNSVGARWREPNVTSISSSCKLIVLQGGDTRAATGAKASTTEFPNVVRCHKISSFPDNKEVERAFGRAAPILTWQMPA